MSGQGNPANAAREDLRSLAEAATPGPWYAVVNDLIGGKSVSTVDRPMSETNPREWDVPADMLSSDANAAYIAAVSPDVVLALLAALAAAEARAERLRQALATVRREKRGFDLPERIAQIASDALAADRQESDE